MKILADGVAQTYYQLGRVAQFLGQGTLLHHAAELLDGELVRKIEEQVADVPEFATKHFSSVFDFRFYRIVLYALIRSMRPQHFVETGVLHGLTSAFLLHAMARNGTGALLSADLPSYPETGPANQDGCNAVLPRGREPGWVVPEELTARWRLLIGPATEVLPAALDELDGIDVFCHDSEHTYYTMWDELTLGWHHLRPGGVLVCDNIDMSAAFFDFAAKHDFPFITLSACDSNYFEPARFAIAVKNQ